MKSNDESEEEASASAKPPVVSKKKGKGNQNRKTKAKGKTGGNSSSKSNESHSTNEVQGARGFSSGEEILNNCGLGISGNFEPIYSAPNTEGYFIFCDECYTQLIEVKQDIALFMSRSEWRHVCALLFYARIANVEFFTHGKKQPPQVRIPLPYKLSIFQPIWAVLADIGTVEDSTLRTRHFPVSDLPVTADATDPDDIVSIVACTQFDWSTSWAAAKKDRAARDSLSINKGKIDKSITVDATPSDTRELVNQLGPILAYVRKTSNQPGTSTKLVADDDTPSGVKVTFDPSSGVPTQVDIEWGGISRSYTDKATAEAAFASLASAAKGIKAARLHRQHYTPKTGSVSFTTPGDTILNDPGSYGAWLGWDPRLWEDYQRVCDLANPVSLWSPSFPKEINGTYMWLIPRDQTALGFFVRMPHTEIATPIWMLALILNMCTLPTVRTQYWYVLSDSTRSYHQVMIQYIRAALQSGTAVEVFR